MQKHIKLHKIAITTLVCGVLWLALFITQGSKIASVLLPLLQWEINTIAPHYHLIGLDIERQRGEAVLKANLTTRRPLMIMGRTVPAGIPMECSTLVGHLWQPLILLLSTVSAACMLRRTHLLLMLALTIIASGALIMMDVPFVLIGALEDMVLSIASPHSGELSAWVVWMNFLNGGGRLALGIAAALSVLAASGMRIHTASTMTSTNHVPDLDSDDNAQ